LFLLFLYFSIANLEKSDLRDNQ